MTRLFIMIESSIGSDKISAIFPGEARLGLSLDELYALHREVEWAINTVENLRQDRQEIEQDEVKAAIVKTYKMPTGPMIKCECGYVGPSDKSYSPDGWPFCPNCKRV